MKRFAALLLLTACAQPSAELAQCKVERAVIALEAQSIMQRAKDQEARHQADKAAARQTFHQLSLYCPRVRG